MMNQETETLVDRKIDQMDEPVKVAGGGTFLFPGSRAGEEAETSPRFVRGFRYYKIFELVAAVGLVIWAYVTYFRSGKDQVHVSITQNRIRNIGGTAVLEREQLAVSDWPVGYWAILMGFVTIFFDILYLPGVGTGHMLHVFLNRVKSSKSASEGFIEWPVDKITLWQNAFFWPIAYGAAQQLLGVTDWAPLVQFIVLAFTFSIYALKILLYRYNGTDVYPFAISVIIIAFAFIWNLIDTHRAAHEVDYPLGYFFYLWFFIVLTAIFAIIVIGTAVANWSAKALVIYTVIFHQLLLWTLVVASFVVQEEDL